MIILPRRFIDVEPTPGKAEMKGEYRLQVIREDGSVKQDTGWFDNIILDSGLNRWGTGPILGGASVGTGVSTPVATQTALDAPATFTNTNGTGAGATTAQASAPYYITYTAVYRTTLGALNGNYSEVGVGWAAGQMFSRALISPSITVLSAEQLDIQYRLRIYPPAVDTTTSVTIGGVSYTVTGRAANVTSVSASTSPTWYMAPASEKIAFGNMFTPVPGNVYTGPIGAITSSPSGTSSNICGAAGTTAFAYSNNSLQATGQTFSGLTDANTGSGFRSIWLTWRTFGAYQYDFGATLPKDNTKTLALNFSVNWARRP